MSVFLSGIGVSRGIAIGKVHILDHDQPEVTEHVILPQHLEDEIKRFQRALAIARQQLKQIRERIPANTAADISEFIDTHILMLEDSVISQAPADIIRHSHCNAEWALKQQLDTVVGVFEDMDDAYLRTRKDDVIHVVNRVLRILLDEDGESDNQDLSLQHHIVVADELAPADIILLHHQGIAGFITEWGGPLSHAAIMARSLMIPAVVGIHRACQYLHGNEQIILDGTQGMVLADFDLRLSDYYRKRMIQAQSYQDALEALTGEPSITLDGKEIILQANIELPSDVVAAEAMHAHGVGLFRTEFLFMNRTNLPDEEEQFRAYTEVVRSLQGKPLTIRTLDLGADKNTSHMQASTPPTNPALGLRAIRLCLKDAGLFMPQLRAILRASAYGPLRIMIPMLSNLQEVRHTLNKIDEAKRSLQQQHIAFDEHIPVGGMIEIPAAAITARHFARHLDFLSIGTNDLIQYTLAIDRMDDEVNYLYDPLHPAVLQLIHTVICAGRAAGIPVSMCGEMAGDHRYTRMLLAMGLHEFSMLPASLPAVKDIIRKSRLQQLERMVPRILACAYSEQIIPLLQQINQD